MNLNLELLTQRITQMLDVDYKGKQFDQYMFSAVMMLIELLRGMKGDEFCLGFLQGAINHINNNKPVVKKEAMH